MDFVQNVFSEYWHKNLTFEKSSFFGYLTMLTVVIVIQHFEGFIFIILLYVFVTSVMMMMMMITKES